MFPKHSEINYFQYLSKILMCISTQSDGNILRNHFFVFIREYKKTSEFKANSPFASGAGF